MLLCPARVSAFSLQVENGVCIDSKVLSEIRKESGRVCSFTSCTLVAFDLLKFLGYDVKVERDTVLIKDYRVVKSVKFLGLSGLEDIKKVVRFLLLGKPVSRSALESVRHLIVLKLKSLGFPRARVDIKCEKVKCGYVVVVSVDRGVPAVVREVTVSAPVDFKRRAIELLSVLKGRPFNYQEFLNLKDKLENLLVKEGYYNCSFSFSVVPVSSRNGVKLKVFINPGKRYTVVFSGNNHFSSQKLETLLTFASARSVDEFEIENSKRRIAEFYRSHGFPFVRVSVITEDKGKIAVLKFRIDEGPFVVVRNVKLKGWKSSRKELKVLIGKPYSEEKVKSFVRGVVSKLKFKGYRDARAVYSVKLPDTLLIDVRRGPLFKVVSVEVSGDTAGCFRGLELPVPYTEKLIEEIRGGISDCYASRGYPDVRVSVRAVVVGKTSSEKRLKLRISVNPGKRYRFGYVIVKGLRRTKLSSIKNLITLSPGKIYSRRDVLKQYSKLLDSRLFSSINLGEVKKNSAISEVIDLQEGSFLRARGFLGYGTDYGGVANGFLTMTSPLGMGLKYFVFGRYRQKEGYDAVFKVMKPAYPFRNWNSGYSIVKKEQIYESFKSDKVLYSFSLERRKTKSFSQTLKFEVSRETMKDTSISEKRFSLQRRLVYLQTYDKRDSVSNPRRGYLSYTKLSLTGLFLGGDSDYTLFEEKFLYLKSFFGFTAAIRTGCGFISSLRGSSVPVQDKFFLGGAESVRGYKFGTISPTDAKGNYIGGKAYGLFSVELRHRIYGQVEGAVFYDSGRVFEKPSKFSFSDWYSSVGLGLRYITPVGPLRIDYGYKLKKVPGQGRGRFHISFGFPF